MTKQQFFMLARSLHLYSSTALFASLIFFCFTGFTLSHGWYLDSAAVDDSIELPTPDLIADSLDPNYWEPDLDAIQDLIKAEFGLRSPTNIELDQDYGEVILTYKAPASDAEVIVSAERMEADFQQGSWLAVINALHKNRDAGTAWSLIVDVTAIGMLFFALTGLVIVFQNKRKRSRSLMIVALGLATPLLIFLIFVPRLGII